MSAPGSFRKEERVCLFGGTFDPIHLAHIRIATEAIRTFHLAKVLFVPAARPPHKENTAVTSFEDRFRMVELACEDVPGCEPSRLEEGEERSYTVETLKRFRRESGGTCRLFFLIGGDAFAEIKTWKDWKEVLNLTEFIVVSRPGVSYEIPEKARAYFVTNLSLPVASSDIRARLARGEPTPELAPAVRKYIQENGLYGWLRATVRA